MPRPIFAKASRVRWRCLGRWSIVAISFLPMAAGATRPDLPRSERPAPRITPVRVPFTLQEIFGQRPVVQVRLGRLPYRMVIHSNARFALQVDHRHAVLSGVTILRHRGAYGIEEDGRLSPLGMESGTMPLMTIGNGRWRNTPALVFETPGDDATGMLGLDWITANRVVLDYALHRLEANPAERTEAGRGPRQLRRGYVALRMTRDEIDGRYYVDVAMGGVRRRMVVSTVANTMIDIGFAKLAQLSLGSEVATYGGPRGATGPIYGLSALPRITIDGVGPFLPSDAQVEDVYAYSSIARPTDPARYSGGMIGEAFLRANGAIVDFGAQRLYLCPTGRRCGRGRERG